MISIGHKTGLFDTLSSMAPSTSEHIASAAGLNERYEREWLGAMVTGRVIEYDPAQKTYYLPAEHAEWLTRSAGVQNMAFQEQYIVMLADVQEKIVDCFSKGGGVSYASFPDYFDFVAIPLRRHWLGTEQSCFAQARFGSAANTRAQRQSHLGQPGPAGNSSGWHGSLYDAAPS